MTKPYSRKGRIQVVHPVSRYQLHELEGMRGDRWGTTRFELDSMNSAIIGEMNEWDSILKVNMEPTE